MTGRRLKSILIIATLLVGALAFLAWSQPWFTFALDTGAHGEGTVEVPGSDASPAVSALALAGLALGAALGMAGPVFRVILGVLETLIGVSLVLCGVVALGDPVAAASSTVTDMTGVAGTDAIAALATGLAATAWPVVCIVVGVLGALVGLAIVVTVRLIPRSGRRYDTAPRVSSDAGHDPVDDWDDLSRGTDPTGSDDAQEPPRADGGAPEDGAGAR